MCVLLLTIAVAAEIYRHGYDFLAATAGIAGLLFFLFIMVPVWTTEIAVTNHRVIFKRDLLRRDVSDLQLRSIEQVGFKQGLLGELFNMGNVEIHGTGVDDVHLPAIADPVALQEIHSGSHGCFAANCCSCSGAQCLTVDNLGTSTDASRGDERMSTVSPVPKRRRRWYNPLSIARSIYNRPRVYLGAAVGIALLWFLPRSIPEPVRETTAWCLGAADLPSPGVPIDEEMPLRPHQAAERGYRTTAASSSLVSSCSRSFPASAPIGW